MQNLFGEEYTGVPVNNLKRRQDNRRRVWENGFQRWSDEKRHISPPEKERTMADEYIKRKEAIVALHGGETVHIPSLMLADKRILAIPAADVVERKRGEWKIAAYGIDGEDVYCSVCGLGGNFPYWNFCPICGADMRKDGDV